MTLELNKYDITHKDDCLIIEHKDYETVFKFSKKELEILRDFLNLEYLKKSNLFLTEEQIYKINQKCSNLEIEQSIKNNVIEIRIEIGEIFGGSCYDNSNPQEYFTKLSINDVIIFNEIFDILIPNLSFIQHIQIMNLLKETIKPKFETEHGYYGNLINYEIWYIPLETLLIIISEIKKIKNV